MKSLVYSIIILVLFAAMHQNIFAHPGGKNKTTIATPAQISGVALDTFF